MVQNAPLARKRLVYLVSHGLSYASNGYAIRTHGIAKALLQAGLDVICLVRPGRPWDFGASDDAIPLEVVKDGVRYIHSRWPDIMPTSAELQLEQSTAIFRELLAVYKPGFVLAASNFEVGIPGYLAATHYGLPFAYEVRGFWEISRSSREPEFALTPEFKLQVEAESWLARLPVPLFTLNLGMREELIKRGADAKRIGLVPNGIARLPELKLRDPELAAKYHLQPDEYVFGYIGSLLAYEGLDELLYALVQLPDTARWRLLLVGEQFPLNVAGVPIQQGYSADLIALAQELGIADRLSFTGRVPHEDVADYYALIDTVVLPRKNWPVCQLVMPLKGIEALSFGMQLLVSDVAPLKELEALSATVKVFRAGDIADLSARLAALLNQHLSMTEREQIRQSVWLQHQYTEVCRPLLQWCSN